VLDRVRDKYKFVFEDTAHFDRAQGLSTTESALPGMKLPPDVIVCANDDMALVALVALKSRDLVGKVALVGFDALPEALGEVKVGNLTATIEQKPDGQGRRAVDILVAFPATARNRWNKLCGWRPSLSPGTTLGRRSALAK
jgi:inositol transport system substrate-binding protein